MPLKILRRIRWQPLRLRCCGTPTLGSISICTVWPGPDTGLSLSGCLAAGEPALTKLGVYKSSRRTLLIARHSHLASKTSHNLLFCNYRQQVGTWCFMTNQVFFFCEVSNFNTLRALITLFPQSTQFWNGLQDSEMDYRICNVRMWSFRTRIHTGTSVYSLTQSGRNAEWKYQSYYF